MSTTENNKKRVEISQIGKRNLLAKLFENKAFKNQNNIHLPHTVDSFPVDWTTTSGTLLEGVDFSLVYTPLKHLGYKAALSVIGKIYASGRTPYALSVVLGVSQKLYTDDIENIWFGISAAAEEHGIKEVSLDLNPSLTGLCISLSAQGYISCEDLKKVPAVSSSDIICITGNLGAAYMGLHVLEREKAGFFKEASKQPDLTPYKYILSEYLSPFINKGLISGLKENGIIPSSGYFITRGLADTVKQIQQDSGFGVKIHVERIPIAKQTFEMADEINIDALTAAMNGGDDYRLLFTIPVDKFETLNKELQDIDTIGHLCAPEVGTQLVTPEGREIEIKAQGW